MNQPRIRADERESELKESKFLIRVIPRESAANSLSVSHRDDR
jgi:hypothetical protein